MSMTLVGLLNSRADPDCHNFASSLQVLFLDQFLGAFLVKRWWFV